MQQVYGHTGNLGNECADHADAIGTLGLVSNQNLAARWVRHNFDTSSCFGSCNNIGEVLENCVRLELKQQTYLTSGFSAVFLIGPSVTFMHALQHVWFALSSFFSAQPFAVRVPPSV